MVSGVFYVDLHDRGAIKFCHGLINGHWQDMLILLTTEEAVAIVGRETFCRCVRLETRWRSCTLSQSMSLIGPLQQILQERVRFYTLR